VLPDDRQPGNEQGVADTGCAGIFRRFMRPWPQKLPCGAPAGRRKRAARRRSRRRAQLCAGGGGLYGVLCFRWPVKRSRTAETGL